MKLLRVVKGGMKLGSTDSTVHCSQCKGTGKEFASMSLVTGETKYRTCSVCGGTGSVAAEKSHFTQYPDLSLRKAIELMEEHGKPSEICIAGDHDFRVFFPDGSKHVLGGFTVGYRGTGPDYTKRLLDAAGFDVSMDEIAKMEPPVTLVAGQPYVAPKSLIFQAATVEEAKRRAISSIPPDSKIVSLEVVNDGTTLRTVKGSGPSEDAASDAAKRNLPEGVAIEQKEIRDECRTLFFHLPQNRCVGTGDSENAALEDGKSKLSEPWRAAAEKEEILQTGSQGKLTVNASTEEQARKDAVTTLPKDAVITSVFCTKPRSGFFGRHATYEVSWRKPWIVQLRVREKKVTLTYRPKAAIKMRFQPSSKSR